MFQVYPKYGSVIKSRMDFGSLQHVILGRHDTFSGGKDLAVGYVITAFITPGVSLVSIR